MTPRRVGLNYEALVLEHGTHVAGILGAGWRPSEPERLFNGEPLAQQASGMCPDIKLYDFLVIGVRETDQQTIGDEFSVIAALQAVRYLDAQKAELTIHGVNLSLAISHQVANLLMARHQELVGQPDRIKLVLCNSATDLGRERYFQGHGMLDVLRALQSV